MDDHDSIFPDPDILWNQICEAERTAPEDRPIVLVVEDDRSSRMLMRHAIRDIVRTDAAGTIADALQMAEAVPYDGVLLDLRLPDGNGTELVEELRERAPYWGVPVVAVTAYALPEGKGPFLEAGFDAYVAKPFEKKDLRRLVEHLVSDPDDALDKGRRLIHGEDFGRLEAESTKSDTSSTDSTEAPKTKEMDLSAVPDLDA